MTGAIAAVALAVLASGCVLNGTWAATAPSSTTPSSAVSLSDVSCVSDDWCMAVGRGPLIEIWDGATWSVSGAPLPPLPPTTRWAGIVDIECGAPDSCLAFAEQEPDDPVDYQNLLGWDGTEWTYAVSHALDATSAFTSFTCLDSGECVIADEYDHQNLIWDAGTVTTTPWPIGTQVYGSLLSCVTTSSCLSVDAGFTSVWNGSAWSPVVATTGWTPTTLSCTATVSSCVGLGWNGYPGTTSTAGTWDGTSWTLTPLPVTTVTEWTGLACPSPTECVGVGVAPEVPLGGAPAQVTWNGQDWFVAPTPPGGSDARYRGIDCRPQWCLAVGTDPSPVPDLVAATYTWTNP